MTQAQEFVKADQEAQDDFVRRCQVVVTVSDDKFLPIKPLDRFCQTTDAAMECRMKVGMRLKETHARDGDMGKFCSAVYDWFQGKYGMKCPKQCRKLQCKSTCMWLDAKKKLNKDNAGIKADMMAAEKVLKGVKEVASQVKDKVAEEKKNQFTIKMVNVKIVRAKKAMAEKTEDLKAAQAKKDKVDQAADKLEKTIAATADNLLKRDDAIMKQKFAIDKAKLKLENLARLAQRDMDRAKEDREEQKSLEDESGKLGKSIAELTKQKAAALKVREADEKAAKEQEGVVKAKAAKMSDAIKELEKYKKDAFVQTDAEADPEHRSFEEEFKDKYFATEYKDHKNVPNLKELVENQYKRAKAADKILQDLNKKISDNNQDIKELEGDIDRLTENKKTADDNASEAKKKADDLDKKAKDGLAGAAKFKKDEVDTPTADMNKAKDARAKEQASKAKAEKTLTFMQNIQVEEQKRVDAAQSALDTVETELKQQEADLEKAKEWLATSTKEKEALEKKEKEMKDKLGKGEKDMMGRIKAYKVAAKDLDKHKPDIVRLHNLQPEP